MLLSLETTATKVELNGLETVIGAFYQSPCKSLAESDFGKLIGLYKSRKFTFGTLSIGNTPIGTLGFRHVDRNQYAIFALDLLAYYSYRLRAVSDVLNIFLHHLGLPVDDVVSLNELNSV